jgi:hypothetical protein
MVTKYIEIEIQESLYSYLMICMYLWAIISKAYTFYLELQSFSGWSILLHHVKL